MNETNHIPAPISVSDAAKILNLSEQQVRGMLRAGSIAGQRHGRTWLVDGVSLSAEAQRRGTKPPETGIRSRKRKKQLRALSFFSGAMGLDLGLERAGIETILACEFDRASRETIATNRPELPLLGDIWAYSANDIRQAAGLASGDEIDLICGGPPCQAFSTAGSRRGFQDARGNVMLRFVDLITELRPRYAVLENVRGLLSAPLSHRPHTDRGPEFPPLTEDEQPGGALATVIDRLEAAGYSVTFNLYNAANYGAPQLRERVILVCSLKGRVPYLRPTHSDDSSNGLPPWKTFKEAVDGLPLEGHTHLNFPEKRLQYYRMLGPGQNWRDLPEDLQPIALGKSYFAGGGKTGFFRRLDWDRPAPTLVTHPAMPATDLAHPTADRPLSVEEYKRVQEFPDDWEVCGSLINQYKQVGNAVPVSLGQAVGQAIVEFDRDRIWDEIPGFPYSRYRRTSDRDWIRPSSKSCSSEQLTIT